MWTYFIKPKNLSKDERILAILAEGLARILFLIVIIAPRCFMLSLLIYIVVGLFLRHPILLDRVLSEERAVVDLVVP